METITYASPAFFSQGTHMEWKQINVPSLSKIINDGFLFAGFIDLRAIFLLKSLRFEPPLLF